MLPEPARGRTSRTDTTPCSVMGVSATKGAVGLYTLAYSRGT